LSESGHGAESARVEVSSRARSAARVEGHGADVAQPRAQLGAIAVQIDYRARRRGALPARRPRRPSRNHRSGSDELAARGAQAHRTRTAATNPSGGAAKYSAIGSASAWSASRMSRSLAPPPVHRELIRLLHSALPGYGAPECVNHPAITGGFRFRHRRPSRPCGLADDRQRTPRLAPHRHRAFSRAGLRDGLASAAMPPDRAWPSPVSGSPLTYR
jgi:hypothetical protein